MENGTLTFILVSALALILFIRWWKNRQGKTSSFNPPPYDYSDQSEDGLGTGVYPPPAPPRRGEAGMFDQFDDLTDDDDAEDTLLNRRLRDSTVRGTPDAPDDLPEGAVERLQHRLRRSMRGEGDDRRPASDGDMLLNALMLGTATGVPMPRDEARVVVREALREEGAQSHKPDRRSDDAAEPPRASDDNRSGFGGGQSNGSGASGNYSSPGPDTGGSPGGDSGGGGDGE